MEINRTIRKYKLPDLIIFSHWPLVCKDESSRQAAFKIYQENRRNQKDSCPNTCLNTNVYFGPLVTGDREENEKVSTVSSLIKA